jgi:hypothetical protein
MLSAFDAELRELLADYAALQAEHQRLIATPGDEATHAAHSARLEAHLSRAQEVIERLQQELKQEPDRSIPPSSSSSSGC